MSDISNVPTEVLVKQHLSRAKTLQKITRRAKQMWGEEWDIELKDAFEMSMKEGWSLPFGVRTNLRVEQEEELRRTFSLYYME